MIANKFPWKQLTTFSAETAEYRVSGITIVVDGQTRLVRDNWLRTGGTSELILRRGRPDQVCFHPSCKLGRWFQGYWY
jgi:hypothetical protein